VRPSGECDGEVDGECDEEVDGECDHLSLKLKSIISEKLKLELRKFLYH